MAKNILALLSSVALGACSIVGVRAGTEEPHYEVIAQVGIVEIRQYDARIAAETTVSGEEREALATGFRRIAAYIFGANTQNATIAMTAPVTQSKSQTIAMTAPVSQTRNANGDWTVRFFMPTDYTLATLPAPNDKLIRLTTVPPEKLAVLRFTGATGADAVAARQTELSLALATTNWRPAGEKLAWFYDPPWTIPFLRRNEVAIPVIQTP